TGKYNYYRATVNFLAYLCKNPDQVNLLSRVCSVNLSREGHYYAFDEAMEIHGIKYIKQNISQNPTSQENLMKEIKSMQSRKERINVFFLEFLGDNVSNTRSEKVINSRKESLWLLIDDLYNTFNGTIPLENSLFKDVKEFNDEGLNNIFTCYNKGIQRLYTMLNGEVLQNVTIKGTGMKDISLYKWNDLNKEINEKKKNLKKAKQPKKINPMIIDIEIVNTTIESSSNIPPPSTDLEQPLPTKNTRYRPSQDEKKILENLASFNEMPSMDKIDPVLNSLLLLNPNHWNARK
ncbi:9649_t:CDS:1, partial [Entrophospora sp. SA101]